MPLATVLRRAAATLATALALTSAPGPARADLHVVVHAGSRVTSLTAKEVLELYMGRTRAFPNGDFALLFDMPRNSAVRADFYLALTGMNQAQINSYWSRLMFTGQTLPPQTLPDDAAMVDIVRRNPSALGYLGHAPAEGSGLRSVLVLKNPG